jgi:aspartate aminotransferase
MQKFLAKRTSVLGTESAFEVLTRAKELENKGIKIIHMEIGEPDFPSPSEAIMAAIKAINQGNTKYCTAAGLDNAREVIANYSGQLRNMHIEPEEVIITSGAKPLLLYTILACVDSGDEVIYPSPGFPIYESLIRFCGGIPIEIPIEEIKENFSIDINKLKKLISDKTKLLILNSPHNPTGGILLKDELEQIARLCIEKDILVLSDEVYNKIYYSEEPLSIASFPGMKERTIIVDAFSKTFSMTGWRLGFGIVPRELVPHFTRLITNSNSCTPPFIQLAGIEALIKCQDHTSKMVKEFTKRRDILVNGLNTIPGFYCHKPKGAFYVFPNISGTGKSSTELADDLLEIAGVATLDGTSFGTYGKDHLRLSFATSIENIYEALNRISSYILNSNIKKTAFTQV